MCASWGRHSEGLEQGSWERMRLLATITIQPHVKKRLTPGQLLPLPWDGKRPAAPPVSREQDMERLRKLMGKRG